MIERGTNKVCVFEVSDRTSDTLLDLIGQHIADGSIIVSDGWSSYGGISRMGRRYRHKWVNHSKHFVNPSDPRVHTQSIEATWGAIKRGMKHLGGTQEQIFRSYLYQYVFRRMYKHKRIFEHLLIAIADQYDVTGSDDWNVLDSDDD
ncbi:hypothetical protein L596_001320 [Steinernema carpocapsae]|uniref:ISXO2-like transposase domain-containing protein n=1 Tax=Steinernema carpocapsae TaxID=34508 RepID=A0A4U8UNE9_STECR|nr:hypothetical protein L596_001320 [Steinernema carpocapsae]